MNTFLPDNKLCLLSLSACYQPLNTTPHEFYVCGVNISKIAIKFISRQLLFEFRWCVCKYRKLASSELRFLLFVVTCNISNLFKFFWTCSLHVSQISESISREVSWRSDKRARRKNTWNFKLQLERVNFWKLSCCDRKRNLSKILVLSAFGSSCLQAISLHEIINTRWSKLW